MSICEYFLEIFKGYFLSEYYKEIMLWTINLISILLYWPLLGLVLCTVFASYFIWFKSICSKHDLLQVRKWQTQPRAWESIDKAERDGAEGRLWSKGRWDTERAEQAAECLDWCFSACWLQRSLAFVRIVFILLSHTHTPWLLALGFKVSWHHRAAPTHSLAVLEVGSKKFRFSPWDQRTKRFFRRTIFWSRGNPCFPLKLWLVVDARSRVFLCFL